MRKRILSTILLLAMIISLSSGITLAAFAVGIVTATAKPCTTKVTVNGLAKSFEAYTINGSDYYKLKDLAFVLKDTNKQFNIRWFPKGKYLSLEFPAPYDVGAGEMAKGDGTTKKATLTFPRVYFNANEIKPSVYNINGNDYYKFNELMDLVDCGVIKDKKTGTININTKKGYEPEFPPIPKGNAVYVKLQQSLYDAYFKYDQGKFEGAADDNYILANYNLTVPDNCTLYVPNGVIFEDMRKIYLGNNSTFQVRGRWFVEYPDQVLKPVSSKTINALLFDGNPTNAYNGRSYVGNCVRVDGNKWVYTYLPIKSASISYGTSVSGVQPIQLNFTRDKRDILMDLTINFHVKGGTSNSLTYKHVRNNIDLMPQLASCVGANIGKNATIDKIDIYNGNSNDLTGEKGKSKPYSIPVNWQINTSGKAPVVENTAEFADSSNLESAALNFSGLSNNTYVSKYMYSSLMERSKKTGYSLISPENKYAIRWLSFEVFGNEFSGDRTNLALFKGKKGTQKNSYVFTVSPSSQDIMYELSCYYPSQGALTFDKEKTYLDFTMSKTNGTPSTNPSDPLLIKYHKKGDASNKLGVLFAGDVRKGQFDLTPYLTTLNNDKGTFEIDKLYLHGYVTFLDGTNIPSTKFTEIACDFSTSAVESVKLGKDIVVNIKAKTSTYTPPSVKATITAAFDINNVGGFDVEKLQLSPANKNTWSENLITKTLKLGSTVKMPIKYTTDTLKWDLKGTDTFGNSYICRGLDFSGITSKGKIDLIYLVRTREQIAMVANYIIDKPIKLGDFGTDTIDVILIAGTNIKTFNAADFTLVLDDGTKTLYPKNDIRIVGLSQTSSGNAKLTFARDFIPETEKDPYSKQLNLYYKGYKVGKISFTNW